MIFEKYLMPDLMLDSFEMLTPEMLTERGVKLIVCDIDNTLATYEEPEPPEKVVSWIKQMAENGISVAFVSNNSGDRVDRFNSTLGCASYKNAHKPSPKAVERAIEESGADKTSAVMLGDQLLTDAWAAKLAGIPAIIVPPIKDKRTAFFRAKRLIEKPYIKKYARINKDKITF